MAISIAFSLLAIVVLLSGETIWPGRALAVVRELGPAVRSHFDQLTPQPGMKTKMPADASIPRRHVLCVDDAEPELIHRARILEMKGWTVTTFCDPVQAAEAFAGSEFDLAIVDYQMPNMNGGELAAKLKRRDSGLRIILYTGATDIDPVHLMFVDQVIHKSEGVARLLSAIESFLGRPVNNTSA